MQLGDTDNTYLGDLEKAPHGEILEHHLVALKAKRPVIKFTFVASHTEGYGHGKKTVVSKCMSEVVHISNFQFTLNLIHTEMKICTSKFKF